MYLLMLLATFISAIYGFNLSARPDYDRDVPKKKAMGIVYKFLFQDKNAVSLLGRVNRGEYENTEYALKWALPGDLIYADFDSSAVDEYNKETTLFYVQNSGGVSVEPFYLRKRGVSSTNPTQGGKEALSDDYLEVGRRFYDGSEMVTKALCLDKAMEIETAQLCTPTPKVDEVSGEIQGYTDSCCNGNYNYVVSYKKLDSRWVNRINLSVSLDFMNAVVDRDYTDNIGVIHWDEDKNKWLFQGKINFTPVYAKDQEEWEAEHTDEHGVKQAFYPGELRNRSTWDLPSYIFSQSFFKNKDNKDICEQGCLFKIRMF